MCDVLNAKGNELIQSLSDIVINTQASMLKSANEHSSWLKSDKVEYLNAVVHHFNINGEPLELHLMLGEQGLEFEIIQSSSKQLLSFGSVVNGELVYDESMPDGKVLTAAFKLLGKSMLSVAAVESAVNENAKAMVRINKEAKELDNGSEAYSALSLSLDNIWSSQFQSGVALSAVN